VESSRERKKRERDREREERLSKGGLTRRGVRHVSHSLQYHLLQTLLLQRSIELTKVGGYIVYSTCSLNPLENEAVVRVSLHPRLSLSLRLSLLPSSSPPLFPFLSLWLQVAIAWQTQRSAGMAVDDGESFG